jgi:hypothetical protein
MSNTETNMEAAEAELVEAERELAQAESDVLKAEQDIEKARKEEHPHAFTVFVIYNGVPKKIDVRRDELVGRLREEAIKVFGIANNPHLLGLFTTSGVELKDDQTIHAAGVRPNEELLLRPSSVRAG